MCGLLLPEEDPDRQHALGILFELLESCKDGTYHSTQDLIITICEAFV